jgi:hypothetical protein
MPLSQIAEYHRKFGKHQVGRSEEAHDCQAHPGTSGL